MRHRIFIAINLPENIKNKLAKYQENWPDLPLRWIKKENLHITLMFLGYLNDDELLEILKITREVAERQPTFSITLKKIIYGPPKKIPPRPPKFPEIITEENEWEQKFGRPSMVWAEGEKSEELGKLQADIEKSFIPHRDEASGAGRPYAPELQRRGKKKVYFLRPPHVTLGRIRTWEFRQMEPEERPEINEDINLRFEVNSIEVMESQLKPKGPDYFVLESLLLGKK